MRPLIDAILTILGYLFTGMVYIAMLGIPFMIGVGMDGRPEVLNHPWTIGYMIYTLVVLGILCIYLWVMSR